MLRILLIGDVFGRNAYFLISISFILLTTVYHEVDKQC